MPKVRFTTSTVSVRGQSQAASMCELPVRWKVACCEHGLQRLELILALAVSEASNFVWSPASSAFEIDGGDGVLQRGEDPGVASFESDGMSMAAEMNSDAQVFGVGAVRGEVDLHLRAAEGLVVDGGQKLDRDENLVAGLGVVEQDDGLEVVAESDAAAVEVDDLRHGAVAAGVELEPDARAGEVVAVERLGNLDDVGDTRPRPWSLWLPRLDQRPAAVVEVERFAVGDVADVGPPFRRGQVVEGAEPLDHLLRLRRERRRNLRRVRLLC